MNATLGSPKAGPASVRGKAEEASGGIAGAFTDVAPGGTEIVQLLLSALPWNRKWMIPPSVPVVVDVQRTIGRSAR